jgi:hypothetical protein
MIVVAYGAGVNSLAMLIGMYERSIKPDLILFADTGAEKPHTYDHILAVQQWLLSIRWPQIQIVKKIDKNGQVLTIEQHCIKHNSLPSIAYGFKSCSLKFKVAPQDKFMNSNEAAKKVWAGGGKVVKFIGYDFNESRRVERSIELSKTEKKYKYEHPLFDWGWDRDNCIDAIKRKGLPVVGKSACYFCPSSKINEIRQLKEQYPELAIRALEIEKQANLTTVKGLGRRFAWSDVLDQGDMFNGFDRDWDLPCECMQ